MAHDPLKKAYAELKKLEHRVESLRSSAKRAALVTIVKLMRRHQVTPQEVESAFHSNSLALALSREAAADARRHVVPKFFHPDTGQTWSGRGRAPRWIVTEELAGGQRENFAIGKSQNDV